MLTILLLTVMALVGLAVCGRGRCSLVRRSAAVRPMNLQLFAGPVYTADIDSQRRSIQVADQIVRYQPNANPWCILLLRSRKERALDPEFHWMEEDVYGYWTQINNVGGYAADAVEMIVDDASLFSVFDIIKVPRTGEQMIVTAVDTATNKLTVTRGYGETAGAVVNDDDYIVNLTNASAEGSNAPASKVKQPTRLYNYCGITRTPFDITGTVHASRQVTTEQERARLTRSKSIDHKMALERKFMFGERYHDATSKRRTTRGVLKFITSNVYDAGGALTESEFDQQVCEPVFRYGSTERKIMVCNYRLASIINGWGKEKLEISQGAKEYGLALKEYISAHGRLLLVPSRIFEQYYQYYSVILDMDYLWIKVLRDTELQRNIQANDADVVKDEYFDEMGLMLKVEKAHGVLKNASS